jgi:hypothetical protein
MEIGRRKLIIEIRRHYINGMTLTVKYNKQKLLNWLSIPLNVTVKYNGKIC